MLYKVMVWCWRFVGMDALYAVTGIVELRWGKGQGGGRVVNEKISYLL